jgi:hypothetical protein
VIQRIPVLSSLGEFFHRREERNKVAMAIARLMSKLDMEEMPFDEGLKESRRDARTRHVSIGMWLIPASDQLAFEDVDFSRSIPCVTCDLRRHGIGVLIHERLKDTRFIAAIADLEESWRFFHVSIRHQSQRPGGWYHLGLNVDGIAEPSTWQLNRLKHQISDGAGE